MTVIYFYGSTSMRQPPTESPGLSGGVFSRSPRRGEKQNMCARVAKVHTHIQKHMERTGMPSHKPLPLPGHMEMSAALQRCWLMSGHVAGLVPGHTHARSSCAGKEGARHRTAPPSHPTPPHHAPTPTTLPPHLGAREGN